MAHAGGRSEGRRPSTLQEYSKRQVHLRENVNRHSDWPAANATRCHLPTPERGQGASATSKSGPPPHPVRLSVLAPLLSVRMSGGYGIAGILQTEMVCLIHRTQIILARILTD
ncbi:hypothetical protein AAFF_G00114460 [Aldrovandia affinis]|uniref:Uncharacterized protein n=1 Tax=Aldrovandia affinis TaxID=143900 RepID=A0AAD7RT86_9TELE|nr:hypothetical protein AAFF_G00114460 [Aldrovandia affinis]